mgnify:FL=1|jgi:hypothetical protein
MKIEDLGNYITTMQGFALEFQMSGTITETIKAFEMNYLELLNLRDFAAFGPISPTDEHMGLHNQLITAFDRQLGISNVVIKVEFLGFNPMEGME